MHLRNVVPPLVAASTTLATSSPPTKILSQRATSADFNPGTFDVTAVGTPFLVLDGGINYYFQNDGNFVIYQGSGSTRKVLWASNTAGASDCNTNCNLIFQGDGNLVIYRNGKAVWNTGTQNRGAQLRFNNQYEYFIIVDKNQDAVYAPFPLPTYGNLGWQCCQE